MRVCMCVLAWVWVCIYTGSNSRGTGDKRELSGQRFDKSSVSLSLCAAAASIPLSTIYTFCRTLPPCPLYIHIYARFYLSVYIYTYLASRDLASPRGLDPREFLPILVSFSGVHGSSIAEAQFFFAASRQRVRRKFSPARRAAHRYPFHLALGIYARDACFSLTCIAKVCMQISPAIYIYVYRCISSPTRVKRI